MSRPCCIPTISPCSSRATRRTSSRSRDSSGGCRVLYLSLKTVHVLSMVLLFGTGLGTAWYKWMADRSGNLAHIAVTNRHVVLADWLFTTPTVILQPATGLWMAAMIGLPLSTPWLAASLVLYAIAGVCWLP